MNTKLLFTSGFLLIALIPMVAFTNDRQINSRETAITLKSIPSDVSSVEVEADKQTVYLKFKNAKSSVATIMVIDFLGQEKFYVEDADISSGTYSILIPSAKKGEYIVSIVMPDFSKSEKVSLKDDSEQKVALKTDE